MRIVCNISRSLLMPSIINHTYLVPQGCARAATTGLQDCGVSAGREMQRRSTYRNTDDLSTSHCCAATTSRLCNEAAFDMKQLRGPHALTPSPVTDA
jgi:hypothetical protein